MENKIPDKSKTQIKKEAEELQKLGVALTRLTRQQLECMVLPTDLKAAVIEAQSITSNIAGRRQRQYIGALMRNVDPEQIRQALLNADTGSPVESRVSQKTRQWLDRLLTGGPGSMEDFLAACPGLERQRLRQLIRNIKKNAEGKPSKSLKTLEQLIAKAIAGQ